jgi:hypothetical protein
MEEKKTYNSRKFLNSHKLEIINSKLYEIDIEINPLNPDQMKKIEKILSFWNSPTLVMRVFKLLFQMGKSNSLTANEINKIINNTSTIGNISRALNTELLNKETPFLKDDDESNFYFFN